MCPQILPATPQTLRATSVLPLCYLCATSVLPLCYLCATPPEPLCYLRATPRASVLPLCYPQGLCALCAVPLLYPLVHRTCTPGYPWTRTEHRRCDSRATPQSGYSFFHLPVVVLVNLNNNPPIPPGTLFLTPTIPPYLPECLSLLASTSLLFPWSPSPPF